CEAGVVTHNYAMCRIFVLQDVGTDCASGTAHILIREVVRDDAAPAIGAKSNWTVIGHWSLIATQVCATFSHPGTLRLFLHPVPDRALCFKARHPCLQPQGLLFRPPRQIFPERE